LFSLSASQGYTPAKHQLNPPSSTSSSSYSNNHSNTTNQATSNNSATYNSTIADYRDELAQHGTVFKGNVQQGESYTMKYGLRGDHEVRLVINEGTRPGYYPIIKMTYYDYDNQVLGSYTSDVSDVKRINDHLTVLDISINAPRYSKRVDFKIIRCSGYLLSVMD